MEIVLTTLHLALAPSATLTSVRNTVACLAIRPRMTATQRRDPSTVFRTSTPRLTAAFRRIRMPTNFLTSCSSKATQRTSAQIKGRTRSFGVVCLHSATTTQQLCRVFAAALPFSSPPRTASSPAISGKKMRKTIPEVILAKTRTRTRSKISNPHLAPARTT